MAINKQINLKWKYPLQPTPLGIGFVRIYRSTEPFEISDLSSQTLIHSREYDSSYITYTDRYDLSYTTYYYRIVLYGDILPDIIASTDLYTVTLSNDQNINIDIDHLVLYYSWGEKNGIDLDTRTSIINPPRDVEVGWNRVSNDLTYLQWAGDNTSSGGSESVLINFKEIKANYPDQNEIKVMLKAFWYNTVADGRFVVQYKSYKGGEMSVGDNYSYYNEGGSLVDSFSYSCYTSSQDHTGDLIGFLNFDLLNKKGSLSFEKDFLPYISAPSNLRADIIY